VNLYILDTDSYSNLRKSDGDAIEWQTLAASMGPQG